MTMIHDLDGAVTYLEQHNPDATGEVRGRIMAAAERMTANPKITAIAELGFRLMRSSFGDGSFQVWVKPPSWFERYCPKSAGRRRCVECGRGWADPPSALCPSCEAYQGHTR